MCDYLLLPVSLLCPYCLLRPRSLRTISRPQGCQGRARARACQSLDSTRVERYPLHRVEAIISLCYSKNRGSGRFLDLLRFCPIRYSCSYTVCLFVQFFFGADKPHKRIHPVQAGQRHAPIHQRITNCSPIRFHRALHPTTLFGDALPASWPLPRSPSSYSHYDCVLFGICSAAPGRI